MTTTSGQETRPAERAPTGSSAPDPDDAKFGLEKYVGEQGVLLGAGSAVMFQLAMKGVGLGVAEHSTTLQRPFDRLRTTLTYVFVMILGTPEERKAISRFVNRMHAPVRSAGRYSAFDPELQLWVAATLAYSGEQIHEKLFGPMDPATRERCYRESWIYGTALQVTEDMWPQTRAEFDDYWAESLAKLEADPAVQCYAKSLMHAQGPGAPIARLQSLVTRGNLDPRTREVLALPWSRRDQRRYDLFWKVFPPVYRLVPRPLRQLHARLIMRDMRRRLKAGKRVI